MELKIPILAQKAQDLLLSHNMKVCTAESCTGGLLAYHFTALPNASSVFDGGVVCYANDIKHKWLGVSLQNLQAFGAVSKQVVEQMCVGVLDSANADIALATSGIAGPGGGSKSKPVGSVYIGVLKKGKQAIINLYHFSGDRHSIQMQACLAALELLIKELESNS